MTQSTKAECIPMAPLSAHPSLLSACLCSHPVPSPEHQHPARAGGRGNTAPWGQKMWPSPSPISHVLTWRRNLLCVGLLSAQKHGLSYTCTWAVWDRHSHSSRLLTPGLGLCKPPQPPALSERLLCLCLDFILNLAGFSLAGLVGDASDTAGLR